MSPLTAFRQWRISRLLIDLKEARAVMRPLQDLWNRDDYARMEIMGEYVPAAARLARLEERFNQACRP